MNEPLIRPIPQQRVIGKMDEYMSRRDYAGAEHHLLCWQEEARVGNDLRGLLMVRNELGGHYRKTAQREKAMAAAEGALSLIDALDFGGTLSAGTTYVNAATMMNAFGENERAMALFERARGIYESAAATRPDLLGGLYNNMALTCAALGRYDEADALYDRAMDAMARAPHGALEQAITCLNRANLVEARDGLEAGERVINALAERAAELLHRDGLDHDGYYAFVCEKCAPTFDYYGFFAEAAALREEAERIYAAGN